MSQTPPPDKLDAIFAKYTSMVVFAADNNFMPDGQSNDQYAKDVMSELKQAIRAYCLAVGLKDFNPFDYVEPCEPECSQARHAYHQGQWDMAVRMEANLRKELS